MEILLLLGLTLGGLQVGHCLDYGCEFPFKSCQEKRLERVEQFSDTCRRTCVTRDCEIKCQDTAQEKLKEEGACD